MSKHETSDRGFKFYEPFETDYGHTISISESSSAEEPKIWMRIEKGEPRFGGDLPACSAPVHLTIPQAQRVIDSLQACIDNHYQGEAT